MQKEAIPAPPWIWTWILAVVHHWLVLISGGLATFAGLLWAQYGSGSATPPAILLSVGLALLLVAFYMAWRDEYRKVLSLNQRLSDSEPKLVGELNYVFAAPAENGMTTAVFLSATITNTGFKSAARGFRLHYVSNTATLAPIAYSRISETNIPDTATSKVFTIQPAESLAERALAPIEKGAPVSGWLLFVVPGSRKDEILSGTTTLLVTFMDYRGDPTNGLFSMEFKPKSSVAPYTPGLSYPIK